MTKLSQNPVAIAARKWRKENPLGYTKQLRKNNKYFQEYYAKNRTRLKGRMTKRSRRLGIKARARQDVRVAIIVNINGVKYSYNRRTKDGYGEILAVLKPLVWSSFPKNMTRADYERTKALTIWQCLNSCKTSTKNFAHYVARAFKFELYRDSNKEFKHTNNKTASIDSSSVFPSYTKFYEPEYVLDLLRERGMSEANIAILQAYYWEEQSMKKIAEHLNVRVQSIPVYLHIIRKEARLLLTGCEEIYD